MASSLLTPDVKGTPGRSVWFWVCSCLSVHTHVTQEGAGTSHVSGQENRVTRKQKEEY